MTELTVAIMAGGQSRRMGTDKSLVILHGKPLVEHLVARVQELGQAETILIANRPDAYSFLGLPTYTDVLPGKGSLGGIYTALRYSRTPYTLILACDMPFVSTPLLKYMIGLAEGDSFDVIVPRVEGYPEGMHAIYRQTCLGPIRERLDAGQLRVMGFYGEVRVRAIDEPEYQVFDLHGLSFFNVNTPEDLQRAQQLDQSGKRADDSQ
jgi:molybdopterin-guanine dinucleotide biosynthesis protein A